MVSQHQLQHVDDAIQIELVKTWPTTRLAKVNAIVAQGDSLVVGGFTDGAKGLVEIWRRDSS